MGTFDFPELETERLTLRLLAPSDGEAVFAHFSDEEVVRFMDIPPCANVEEALDIIRFHMEDSGCRWGLFDKSTGRLAGTCGYHCWHQNTPSKAELGYDLSRAYWGQGLMSEALEAVIGFGFEQMGLTMIEATVEPDNERSIQLLLRLDFERGGEPVGGLAYFSRRP